MAKNKSINRKSIILLTIVFLGIGSVLSASYAFFIKYHQGETFSYTTGTLQVTLDTSEENYGQTINLASTVAITDTEGSNSTPYLFKIKNTGTVTYQFNLKLISDTNKVATDNCTNNQLPIEYIKVMVDEENPNTLNNYNDNILMNNLLLAPDEEMEISIRIWLTNTTPISQLGKHFHGKLVTDAIAIVPPSVASAPNLINGMIPIKYNGETWEKADDTNANNSWYDYDNKKWANVALVTNATRDTYISTSVGTPITESDILAYYVWIPRYKYKLFNVNFSSVSPQSIDVIFEDNDAPISNGKCIDKYDDYNNGCYYSHPAFWWDQDSDGIREVNEELEGIWVGKFELSGTNTNPLLLPNQTPYSNKLSTLFTIVQNIKSEDYLTITGVNQSDSHIMKSLERGAIAYLAQSKYGINKEVGMNNYKDGEYGTLRTGCGSPPGSTSSTTCNSYNTTIGQLASTTGNIYGVYDMSGGAYDRVMGVMEDNTNTNTPMAGNSGFAGKSYNGTTWSDVTGVTFPDKKYYDLYEYGTTKTDQDAYNRSILGDAVGETRNWYNDTANMILDTAPWLLKGGLASSSNRSGTYRTDGFMGGSPNVAYGTRTTIIKEPITE